MLSFIGVVDAATVGRSRNAANRAPIRASLSERTPVRRQDRAHPQLSDSGDFLAGDALRGRKLAGKPLIEWVARRMTEAAQLTGVVASLEETSAGRALQRSLPPDIPALFSEAPDRLSRLLELAGEYRADALVRVPLGSPFVDGLLIDRLCQEARQTTCDYLSYRSNAFDMPVGGCVSIPLGVAGEWISAEALRRMDAMARDFADRDAPAEFISRYSDQFRLEYLPLPNPLDRDDLRLTIQGEEDWDHTETILDALDPDEWDWRRVAGLLENQPRLRSRMAELNAVEAAGY